MVALVHAPIEAPSGHPIGLGLASFDDAILARAQSMLNERLGRFVQDDTAYRRYTDALSSHQ